MKRTNFFACAVLAGLASLCSLAPTAAQESWPTKAVRMVMPFPPGSGTDVLARLISERLSRTWGQPVTVDNMSGAGGNIGGQAAQRL